MKINDNRRNDIEILLNILNQNKRCTKSQNVQQTTLFVPVAKSGDAVTFELSQQAKNEMLDAYIDETLSNGKPLEGVTKEEFNEYHYRKTGNHLFGEKLDTQYSNAVKGYNNIAAERPWRNNDDYRIPYQIWDSDEVNEDLEQIVEKYKSGADLEKWEMYMFNTIYNVRNMGQDYKMAQHTREQNIMQSTIADMLSEAGIELAPDEELTFSVWGRNVEVSGANNEETNRRVQELFLQRAENKEKYGENVVTGQRMSNFYYAVNRDKQQDSGFTGMWLKAAVRHLEDSGTGITVFDLSLDDDGNIIGLPEELNTFIKENAKGEFDDPIPYSAGKERRTVVEARNMREAFKSAVKTVERGEYEKYRNMKCYLTYKNGILGTK